MGVHNHTRKEYVRIILSARMLVSLRSVMRRQAGIDRSGNIFTPYLDKQNGIFINIQGSFVRLIHCCLKLFKYTETAGKRAGSDFRNYLSDPDMRNADMRMRQCIPS